ncbi:hypothetical protein SDC9_99322 [bioreactor metagenome]|uniref:Uncharacterized protein n=1 Tax=bioreactor metagenome TaxID=1076179 RepID=A0A645AH76_9ZZZZ
MPLTVGRQRRDHQIVVAIQNRGFFTGEEEFAAGRSGQVPGAVDDSDALKFLGIDVGPVKHQMAIRSGKRKHQAVGRRRCGHVFNSAPMRIVTRFRAEVPASAVGMKGECQRQHDSCDPTMFHPCSLRQTAAVCACKPVSGRITILPN